METSLKEINSYTRQLNIKINWNSLEKDFYNEFKKAKSRYSMPGFRKGKVPDAILKKNLGPSIEANFAENSINQYYRQALEKLDLIPINQASIDNLNFKEGQDLSFSAKFEVNPEIKLPKYQNKIKVKAIKYLHENEDVNQALINYQEQHANIKTIENGAESGHFIRGDFQALDDNDLPVVGNKLENQYIRLGFGLFKNEIEKSFFGLKEGDETIVTINNKDKPTKYKVKINKVEEQILPELNDELARIVNEDINTLEELKNKIKIEIQTSLDKDHKELVKKEIINYFIDNSKIDAPESMIEMYLDNLKEDLKKRKESYNEDEMKNNYKSHAEWNIKWYLIKDKIVEEESLDVSKEELQSKIDELIENNKKDKDQISNYFKDSKNKQNLYNEVLNEKLFEKLLDYAKVKVVEQSTKELRKKQVA